MTFLIQGKLRNNYYKQYMFIVYNAGHDTFDNFQQVNGKTFFVPMEIK